MQPIEIEQRGLITVVHLGPEYGSLDVGTAEDLEGRLSHLAGKIDPPFLLLDCWNTDYFGSLFISVLIRCYRTIRERDGRFVLCCLRLHLRRELNAMNLDVLWPTYGSLEEAVQSMTRTAMANRRT
jgi:anti-anti-sigma factor